MEKQLDHPLVSRSRFLSLALLLTIITVAVLVRLSIDFSTPLMPKVNGAYYLVQARSVAEKGELAYSTPFFLVFWLSGHLANALHSVRGGDLSDSVILACKLVDSILPAFACIPIFLLSRKWSEARGSGLGAFVVPALFSVLYYPALVMTSDFQKNALGMVWFSFLIYFLYVSIRSPRISSILGVVITLLLGSVTHVGAFGAALAYAMTFAVVWLLWSRLRSRKAGICLLSVAVSYGLLLLILHFVPLPRKVALIADVITHPLTLFNNSIVVNVLAGKRIPVDPMGLFNILLTDTLAFMSIWVLLKKRSEIDLAQKITVVAASLTALMLASPLTNWEFGAGRLFLMGYLPASVLIAFLLQHTGRRKQVTLSIVLLICIIGTAIAAWKPITATAIPEESLEELNDLKQYVADPENTLVITRHGLEWWAAWTLRTKVSQEYNISRERWDRHETVLFLQQVTDLSPFGPAGYGGPPFLEVKIPSNAEKRHRGRYYLLAESDEYPDFYPLSRPVMSQSPPGIRDSK